MTFSEIDGVRYLHFGTEWVQGAMRLKKPDAIELEYAQQMMAWMLFLKPAAPADLPEAAFSIAQLGLGAAALTKFCYRRWPQAQVTAVELNPSVIAAARTMFELPSDDDRLRVIESDAGNWVDDPANRGRFDVLQVDLYDASARGPVLDSVEFYQACRACLRSPGMMTVNLFGDHPSFGRNMKTLAAAFAGRVVALPEAYQGNQIAIAFEGPPLEVGWSELYRRAEAITRATGLPAAEWVHGLREWGKGKKPAKRPGGNDAERAGLSI